MYSDDILRKSFPGYKPWPTPGYPRMETSDETRARRMNAGFMSGIDRSLSRDFQEMEEEQNSRLKKLIIVNLPPIIEDSRQTTYEEICGTCKYKRTCPRDSPPSQCYDRFNASK